MALLSKAFIIASAVTVFRSVEMLMAALLMRQFSPSVPTMEATSSDAERMLCSLTISEGVKFVQCLFYQKDKKTQRRLWDIRVILKNDYCPLLS